MTRRRITPLLPMLLLTTGCAGLQDRIAEHIELHRSRHEAHVASKQQCHDEEMAQLEQEQALARRESIDSLRSTLMLDIDQRFVVTDMQVDEAALKDLMAKRDEDYSAMKRVWDELESRLEDARSEGEIDNIKRMLRDLEARAAENGCCVAPPPCEQPSRLPELPAKRPILPAEIPMVIKLQMRMGMENLGLEEARIRRLPTLPAKRACQPVCRNACDERCNCPECQQKRESNRPHTNYDDGPVRLPPPRRSAPKAPAPEPPDDLVQKRHATQASFNETQPRRQIGHPNDWVSAPR